MSQRLFLIDGTAQAYRFHFALARTPLTNSQGMQTGATYLFTTEMIRFLEREQPDAVAVAFDTPEPTFRHRRFGAYKATREKMPQELADQLPWIRKVLEALGVVVVELPGWEADDVLGTLARQGEAAGFDVFLVTGDKDFFQLVSPRVRIYSLARSGEEPVILGEDEVAEKFGVHPGRVIDVLGLMGDASDNIPGVPGVGRKTALRLLERFGSLEEVLEHASEIERPKLRASLEANRKQAVLSKELATIRVDAPVDRDLADCAPRPRDGDRLVALFQELEFHQLLDRVARGEAEGPHRYRIAHTPAEIEAVLEELEGAGAFAFDLETTSLDVREAAIVGVSLAWKEREAVYLPLLRLENPPEGAPAVPPGGAELSESVRVKAGEPRPFEEGVWRRLRALLEDPSRAKGGQNVKYDLAVLRRHGVAVRGIAFDTMVAAWLLQPNVRQYNLDALALRFLGTRKIPTESLIGKRGEVSMADLPVEQVGRYACEDADVCWRLWVRFRDSLQEAGLRSLFEDVEVPLIPVLESMERHGIAVDVKRLRALGTELSDRIAVLVQEIHAIAGEAFNVQSPQQLGRILFDKLQIHRDAGGRKPRRTKIGYATDVQTLEKLQDHPLVAKVLEHRSLAKLVGTYIEALPQLVHPRTGRIHTSFHQTGAATGRLSSSDPNLQNIPVRTEAGRRIRQAFVPGAEGWGLLSADYNQIELRVLAHLSEDPRLAAAFREGRDIHRETASLVFGVIPEAVTKEMRSRAKVVNFGVLYGMGAQRLAREFRIPPREAQAFIDAYFRTFSGVKVFFDETIARARETGAVRTLLGRRREIPELRAASPRQRVQGERIAGNTPVQGSAADIIKKAMVAVDARLRDEGRRARMLVQVHDELVLEAPEEEREAVERLVREEMEGAVALRVPLRVDVGWGRHWLEAHGP